MTILTLMLVSVTVLFLCVAFTDLLLAKTGLVRRHWLEGPADLDEAEVEKPRPRRRRARGTT